MSLDNTPGDPRDRAARVPARVRGRVHELGRQPVRHGEPAAQAGLVVQSSGRLHPVLRRSKVRAFTIERHGGFDEGSEFDQWLSWAGGVADRFDPLVSNSAVE